VSEIVYGVKESAKALRRIDPELRKEFDRKVREIASPIIDQAKSNYSEHIIPSGTRRVWSQNGRKLFPFTVSKARQGIRTKVDTSNRNRSAISVIQLNPAAAIFEFAGVATDNSLGRAFTAKGRRPARVMWPAFYAKQDQVTGRIEDLVVEVEQLIERELG